MAEHRKDGRGLPGRTVAANVTLMRRGLVALAVTATLWPAAVLADPIPPDAGQMPCTFVSKHDVSDAKARRRCDLPNGTVGRFEKRGRWTIIVG